MSSETRIDDSFLAVVSLPIICVLTGPEDGNVSIMASDWNLTTASDNIGWNTPQAPAQGSVVSSYFKPSSFKP